MSSCLSSNISWSSLSLGDHINSLGNKNLLGRLIVLGVGYWEVPKGAQVWGLISVGTHPRILWGVNLTGKGRVAPGGKGFKGRSGGGTGGGEKKHGGGGAPTGGKPTPGGKGHHTTGLGGPPGGSSTGGRTKGLTQKEVIT